MVKKLGISLQLQIDRNDNGTIDSISLSGGGGLSLQVNYSYDVLGIATDELQWTQNAQTLVTQYAYDTAQGMVHYLTQVTTTDGSSPPVTTLTATYDSLGRLSSLTDAYGRAAQVGVGSSDGSSGSQVATNLAAPGSTSASGSETVYDDQGNVARTIQTLASR